MTLLASQQKALVIVGAILAGFWLGQIANIPAPFWICLTIIMMLTESNNCPIHKSIYRIVGAVLGSLLAVIFLQFTLNSRFLFLFTLSFVVFILNYLGLKTKWHYSFFYASLTFYLVFIIVGTSAEQFEFFITWRTIEIGLGVVICILALQLYPKEPVKEVSTHENKKCIEQGIKVTISSVLAYWICTKWGWYDAVEGVASALLINLEMAKERVVSKSCHRILGCFLGGLIGLLSIMLISQNVLSISLLIMIVIYGLAYAKFTFTRYNYIFVQALIAFCMVILPFNNSYVVNVDPAIKRLAGILLGAISASVVNHIFMWGEELIHLLKKGRIYENLD